jgi:hypothetical protein
MAMGNAATLAASLPTAAAPVAAANPSALMTLAASQPVRLPTPTVTPVALQPLANAQGSTQGGQEIRHERGGHPLISSSWLSYVGGPGEDVLAKVAVTGTGNGSALYAAGWTTDPADGKTLQLELIKTTNNATSPPKVYLSPSSPGNNAQAFAVDLAHNELPLGKSSGNIIVAGYVSHAGAQNLVVESIKSDLSAVNWAVTNTNPDGGSVIYGIKSVGGVVYFTGTDDGNLMVGKLDAATGDPIYASEFTFTDQQGNALTSVGMGIGVDATGKTDVAMQLTMPNGTDLPGFGQVTADGQSAQASFFPSAGPGASLNAVQVDGAGNASYTGVTYSTPRENYDGYSYLLAAKIAPDGQTPLYANLYALENQAGQHVFNWAGYDNKLDVLGNSVMATTYDDGRNAIDSYGQWLLKIDAAGNVVDQGDGGVHGTNSVFGYGVAMDATKNIWEVGKTNSPDLPANGFQTTYGGGPWDGWIAGFTSP